MTGPTPFASELLDRLGAPAGDPSPPPRTLLVLAHPDDETVGASSRLTRIELAGLIYVTDGAPRDGHDAVVAGFSSAEEYAHARRAETLRALAHAGISSERAVFLNYPQHQVAFRLWPLTADLRRWILGTRPEVVLTHPYEGGHPDNDAVAFAVQAAVATIAREMGTAPVRMEFTSYHACGDGWVFGEFLPTRPVMPEHVVPLTADGRALKQRLIACYPSQASTLQNVPLEQERFRVAPDYDFTRPPHEGAPLYARFPLGLTVRDWCALASTATERLQRTHLAYA